MKALLIILVSIAILILPGSAAAQITFERWYGGTNWDIGHSVLQTNDGGYTIGGWTGSFGVAGDVWLIKTDTLGDTIWTKTIGGSGLDEGRSMHQTHDKGFIITGKTESYGAGGSDVYLVRTDTLGDTLWTRSFGGTDDDIGYSVQQTQDKGYIITGSTISFGAGSSDVYFIRTDSLGDTLWTKTFGANQYDYGRSVQQIQDGGYVVTGYTDSYGAGGGDVWLIKTDILGDTIWTKTYGGISPDIAYSVQQTQDKGLIIAGWTGSYGAAGRPNIWLIKTDTLGDTLWTKTFGGSYSDYGYSVQQTNDGGYIISGSTQVYNTPDAFDAWLIKTDSLGNELWNNTFGGYDDAEEGYSVQQTTDGGYIMAGYTYSYGAGAFDAYLIKTDSLGNVAGIDEQIEPGSKTRDIRLIAEPNPFTTSTLLKLSDHQSIRVPELKIYDASGRLVKSVKLTTNTYQFGADFVPGIYFLKLNDKPAGKVVKVR